ncbi:MFS general substrate transporter [Pholiota molesta]|nr:MFS general substrate transporter [Pholiota molesta]
MSTPAVKLLRRQTAVGETDSNLTIALAKAPEKSDQVDPEHSGPFQAFLQDVEDPQHLSTARKWIIVTTISSAALCVASASSMAGFAETGVSRDLHVGHTVAILSISLYILGLGLGPLIFGPLSEIYGRNLVYRVSYGLFFALNFPVAFAPDISVHLIFRFLTGFCGSAFLSVAGGSVSDLFDDKTVASPMALYTICLSGWTYRILLIWTFMEFIVLFLFVPETYVPVLEKKKAERLRNETGDLRIWASLERQSTHIGRAIATSCYQPFALLFFDHMAFLLDLWNAVILGILYLTFQAYPFIFGMVHGFNEQMSGMSFLGIGVGMIMACLTQPLWNRFYERTAKANGGTLPPESRLVMGEIGGVLIPIGLFWLAFTTYHDVPWVIPILASVPFGAGIYFVFTSTFTYMVTAYRPIAASAMAANSAMRSTFAAVFPLFSGVMYDRLGTVGATALLAGLTAILAPLPFIFRRIGGRLRQRSRFAHR